MPAALRPSCCPASMPAAPFPQALAISASRLRRWSATSPTMSAPRGVSRQLSAMLDAPLVAAALQPAGRRLQPAVRGARLHARRSATARAVPANCAADGSERRQRFEEIHQPFHRRARRVARPPRRSRPAEPCWSPSTASRRACVGGPERPWELGVLSNRDRSFADRFLTAFQAANPARSSRPQRALRRRRRLRLHHPRAWRGARPAASSARDPQRPDRRCRRPARWATLVAEALRRRQFRKGNHDGR